MRNIFGIGETVMDIIFRNDQPTAAVPGGSTFNSMISLGRITGKHHPDCRILMITETGSDHIGDIVVNFMEANHVLSTAVTRNPGTQSHISLAFLDSNNNAQYEFYKDHAHARLTPDSLNGVSFKKDDLVLFGSYFAINPVIRDYTKAVLTSAREAGAILYYDINFRKTYINDIPDLLPTIEENCALSDVVRGSAEDFTYLFGTDDPQRIYEEHIRKFCPIFICTRGGENSEVFTGGRHFSFPVPQIETVSTIGAGDNFNAGCLYTFLDRGIGREDIKNLSPEIWEQIILNAGEFSANVCQSMFNYVDEDFDL